MDKQLLVEILKVTELIYMCCMIRLGCHLLISLHIFVGHRLVELKDDVDLKKTIDTYEHVVRRLLSERKSVGMYIDTCGRSSCLLSDKFVFDFFG